ncbi:M28 family peptidase [Porticoccaceae bacterium]|jgi:Zn-dependent M28 family amino/carboxypeptidase|nr:M28 family peptidase [Porticoccaceae bacterium]MDA8878678.1 M28 family peptidase [Porticoccaceae bacterium]MDA8941513.1 M28 family peptidase [Porticoccaceae bacterium]MDA9583572.1 M28 family peptidase [Porticoccaceae bacterium]MDB2401053.1 M28 family peptidase [Porticoccaceae bacterium]
MNHFYFIILTLTVFVGLSACSEVEKPFDNDQTITSSYEKPTSIDSQRLSNIVKVLASDEFEGRAPGGPGEAKTIEFLIDQFQSLGLEPGGTGGTWTHAVPLVHTQLATDGRLSVSVGDMSQNWVQGLDVAVSTVRPVDKIDIQSAQLVFVGFGASAPERNWDDYGEIDLTGKIAIFLVNDPDFSANESEPVSGRFGNKRMTYYGRWAYKYEEAARRGALAALVIHEDKAAGYGWNVASSGPGSQFALAESSGPTPPILQGWLHYDAASALFAAAGMDLVEQRRLARSDDFSAFELPQTSLSASFNVSMEKIESQNVLARLPGHSQADEILMVSAHWDAYGQGEPDSSGRTVRPGANDDALGTAGVIELARVLKAGEPMARSVVFAAWTAEEAGLLGSAAYAAKPIYPLHSTVANFTLDILQTAGLAKDVILVGEGQSDLEEDLMRAAALQSRVVTPENLPENGLFFRADHFSLARQGVPVLLLMGIAGGADLIEGGRVAGDQWIAEYTGNCYHQTCDAWSADWDLRGAVEDIELFHTILRDLGDSTRWPQLKSSSEFKAIRSETDAQRVMRSVAN